MSSNRSNERRIVRDEEEKLSVKRDGHLALRGCGKLSTSSKSCRRDAPMRKHDATAATAAMTVATATTTTSTTTTTTATTTTTTTGAATATTTTRTSSVAPSTKSTAASTSAATRLSNPVSTRPSAAIQATTPRTAVGGGGVSCASAATLSAASSGGGCGVAASGVSSSSSSCSTSSNNVSSSGSYAEHQNKTSTNNNMAGADNRNAKNHPGNGSPSAKAGQPKDERQALTEPPVDSTKKVTSAKTSPTALSSIGGLKKVQFSEDDIIQLMSPQPKGTPFVKPDRCQSRKLRRTAARMKLYQQKYGNPLPEEYYDVTPPSLVEALDKEMADQVRRKLRSKIMSQIRLQQLSSRNPEDDRLPLLEKCDRANCREKGYCVTECYMVMEKIMASPTPALPSPSKKTNQSLPPSPKSKAARKSAKVQGVPEKRAKALPPTRCKYSAKKPEASSQGPKSAASASPKRELSISPRRHPPPTKEAILHLDNEDGLAPSQRKARTSPKCRTVDEAALLEKPKQKTSPPMATGKPAQAIHQSISPKVRPLPVEESNRVAGRKMSPPPAKIPSASPSAQRTSSVAAPESSNDLPNTTVAEEEISSQHNKPNQSPPKQKPAHSSSQKPYSAQKSCFKPLVEIESQSYGQIIHLLPCQRCKLLASRKPARSPSFVELTPTKRSTAEDKCGAVTLQAYNQTQSPARCPSSAQRSTSARPSVATKRYGFAKQPISYGPVRPVHASENLHTSPAASDPVQSALVANPSFLHWFPLNLQLTPIRENQLSGRKHSLATLPLLSRPKAMLAKDRRTTRTADLAGSSTDHLDMAAVKTTLDLKSSPAPTQAGLGKVEAATEPIDSDKKSDQLQQIQSPTKQADIAVEFVTSAGVVDSKTPCPESSRKLTSVRPTQHPPQASLDNSMKPKRSLPAKKQTKKDSASPGPERPVPPNPDDTVTDGRVLSVCDVYGQEPIPIELEILRSNQGMVGRPAPRASPQATSASPQRTESGSSIEVDRRASPTAPRRVKPSKIRRCKRCNKAIGLASPPKKSTIPVELSPPVKEAVDNGKLRPKAATKRKQNARSLGGRQHLEKERQMVLPTEPANQNADLISYSPQAVRSERLQSSPVPKRKHPTHRKRPQKAAPDSGHEHDDESCGQCSCDSPGRKPPVDLFHDPVLSLSQEDVSSDIKLGSDGPVDDVLLDSSLMGHDESDGVADDLTDEM